MTNLMSPSPITDARWQLAQKAEADYWRQEAKNPEKLQRDIADGHHFTAGVLDIRPLSLLHASSVLDIAGGPYPIGAELVEGGWLNRYAVLDPAEYVDALIGIERIRAKAEGWDGGRFDEVFGYNVLQHVVDPAAVMATARRCAIYTVRWFDVVDTPVYPVHPHSISADWLRAELSRDGFRIVRDID